MTRARRRERLTLALEKIARQHALAAFRNQRRSFLSRMQSLPKYCVLLSEAGQKCTTARLLEYLFEK